MNFHAKKDADREPIFQMTAMVDVVFMLLAFFVLASEFRQPERDFTTGYGEARPPVAGVSVGDFPSRIPVRLRKGETGVKISIAQASLRDNDFDGIRAKLSEINMPAIGVHVLAEAELTVEQVAQALDAVLASPMKKVSISELKVVSTVRETRIVGD